MEVMIILLSILPFVLALCSLWVVWWRNEQIAPTDASRLQMFLAIFWAAASAYLFCPALYSTLATASHHPEYNPHINEIRQFLEGWLSVLPPATLLPGVLALQNRWHGGQVFGKLAALYACTVMLVITFITGTNMGGLLISQLLPSLWGWWEILFRQHGWGGTIYDLEHCDYSFSSTVLWLIWIGIVSTALLAAWFLFVVRARVSRLVQWLKQRG